MSEAPKADNYMSDEFADTLEEQGLKLFALAREREPWIPNTEDVRGAFVAGFAHGVHVGMQMDVQGIAEDLVREAQADG